MSDSSFRRFFAKAKDFVRPRGSVRKHKSKTRSTESLPPTVARERVSSPFKSPNAASSSDSLPISPPRTQVYHEEPQEIERTPPIVDSSATALVSSQFIGPHPTSLHQLPSNTLVPTPWESWTIDQDFLAQVHAWNAAHPENTLDQILNKTSTLIERHDIFLELIPDGPIPFRGFVKALAHLVKLGITIAEAKVVALKFAQDVLQWVEKLAAAFGDGGGGPFIEKAWANLADIRKLIEEVCLWAHGMLKSGLTERVSVNDKILEFREQFTQAIERFEVVSHIHLAIGHDRLNQHMHGLAVGQDHMNQHLATISRAMAQKRQLTMPDVTYEHQKKIPCAPGTRRQVLTNIMDWILDISDGSPSFFWLSGDPGVGKSAVTASIAEECRSRKLLWAQYFINRNDARTIDPQLYFPSIAKQMSECGVPAVDDAVRKTLQDQPYLLSADISLEQATKLFVNTIQVAAASTLSSPVAIVIDALDETDAKRLRDTVEIFSQVLIDLPSNAKVFISSRVENVIADNFARHPRVRNIHLSAKGSIAEVTTFMEGKVRKIIKDHHLTWSQWGEGRMRRLCSQASGLFIWAVTAIEYIQTQIEESGTECLDGLLEELNTNGMDNINVLYLSILRRTYQHETSTWQTQRFQRIVGAVLVQQSPLSIDDLKGLLDLRNPTNKALVDVEHFVRRLRTILVPGVKEITGRTIPRVHKSFSDFVTTKKAEEFCVDLTDSNGELALQCIDQLKCLWEGEMPGQLHYAISHWSSHLSQVVGVQVDVEEVVDDTASADDAYSMVSNLEQHPSASISVEPKPTAKPAGGNSQLTGGNSQLHSISISPDRTHILYARGRSILLKDVETGLLPPGPGAFYYPISPYATTPFIPPLPIITPGVIPSGLPPPPQSWGISQDYTGYPVDNPNSSSYIPTTPLLSPWHHWQPLPQPSLGSSPWTQPSFGGPPWTQPSFGTSPWGLIPGGSFMGHTDDISLAAFSPDGRYIVSASYDHTVRIWNAATGEPIGQPLGHAMLVYTAFFSPDGQQIVSASSDCNVCTWDAETGQMLLWDLETGHKLTEYFTCSGFTNPRLSFNTVPEAGKYIETPPKSNSSLGGGTQSSYFFQVGKDGVVGGASNAWLYTNEKIGFTMGTYSGQLVMRRQ